MMKEMKNLLTILLILLPLSAHAWGVVVTSGGVAAAGLACGETATISQTTYNNHNGSNMSQRVKNASSVEICKVVLSLYVLGGSGSTYTCEIRTAENGGGSRLGSQLTYVASVGAGHIGAHTFEWTSDYPNPTGDYYIYVTEDNDSVIDWADNDPYETGQGNYCAWMGGTPFTGYDLYFEVYTRQ